MSRVPSGLLYLAIYNPTLQPKHPVDDDDEDAEEQAHILFYTSKEKAVSRDRMLRQIGLAKALVNFSALFNPHDECESVHSQSRRMILVSPEPNFWFNATVELPKKMHGSTTSKPSSKGKSKPPAPKAAVETVYDYDDGTVHDIAIRSQVLHAYERFKLSHGSFASILSELGQEALEVQLERFFTPWAWSWNLEDKPQIVEQLGVSLQPYYSSLAPLLDAFSVHIPESVAPAVFTPTHIIPSTRYTSSAYPTALAELLMTMIPPPTSHADDPLARSIDTIREPIPSPEPNKPKSDSSSPWLPAVNMNMDVRKWNWQSYLTFGKSRNQSPEKSSSPSQGVPKEELQTDDRRQEVHVDAKSLQEALTSEGLSVVVPDGDEGEDEDGAEPPSDSNPTSSEEEKEPDAPENALQLEWGTSTQESPMSSMTILPRPRAPSPPRPSFLCRRVYLAPPEDPISTQKCDIHFYVHNSMILTLISDPSLPGFTDVEEFLSVAAQHANHLLEEIQLTIQNAALARMSESLPTASKILQSPDQHAISTEQYLLQSPGFASDSGHLQNAILLFERDPDVLEVYSRGQNPQNWHIAKRGLAATTDSDDDAAVQSTQRLRGRAFLEVFKKEASLPDVDNVLAGTLRKSGVAESGLV